VSAEQRTSKRVAAKATTSHETNTAASSIARGIHLLIPDN